MALRPPIHRSLVGNRLAAGRPAQLESGLQCLPDIMLLTILLVILVLALAGGGFGYSRYGYAGWSPALLIVIILLVLLFTNRL